MLVIQLQPHGLSLCDSNARVVHIDSDETLEAGQKQAEETNNKGFESYFGPPGELVVYLLARRSGCQTVFGF